MLFITIDGLGDKVKKGKKTPLEIARTPNLDFLAKKGRTGLVYTVGKGIAPESDIALTAVLGYDPYKFYTGRGPLEAFGFGIPIKKGDLVLRANFATLRNDKIIDRRAGRNLSTREALKLERTVNLKVKLKYPFLFKSIGEHRGILVIRGNFSADISNTDPGYEKKGLFGVVSKKVDDKVLLSKPLKKGRKEKEASLVLNDFTKQVIEVLNSDEVNKKRVRRGFYPANVILTRDAGTSLPVFNPKKRNWAAIVGYPLEIGLALRSGMKVFRTKYSEIKTLDIYKYLYQCLEKEISAAKKILNKNFNKFSDFWIHFKPVDIPGHDGRPKDKIKMIEILDKKFFSGVKKNLLRKNNQMKVIVTADHSTPCLEKFHSKDPVPLLLYDGLDKDKVKKFSERDCRKGSLGFIMGKDIMKLTDAKTNRSSKFSN